MAMAALNPPMRHTCSSIRLRSSFTASFRLGDAHGTGAGSTQLSSSGYDRCSCARVRDAEARPSEVRTPRLCTQQNRQQLL